MACTAANQFMPLDYFTCTGSFSAHRLTKSDKPDIISAIKGTLARLEAQIY